MKNRIRIRGAILSHTIRDKSDIAVINYLINKDSLLRYLIVDIKRKFHLNDEE